MAYQGKTYLLRYPVKQSGIPRAASLEPAKLWAQRGNELALTASCMLAIFIDLALQQDTTNL